MKRKRKRNGSLTRCCLLNVACYLWASMFSRALLLSVIVEVRVGVLGSNLNDTATQLS